MLLFPLYRFGMWGLEINPVRGAAESGYYSPSSPCSLHPSVSSRVAMLPACTLWKKMETALSWEVTKCQTVQIAKKKKKKRINVKKKSKLRQSESAETLIIIFC